MRSPFSFWENCVMIPPDRCHLPVKRPVQGVRSAVFRRSLKKKWRPPGLIPVFLCVSRGPPQSTSRRSFFMSKSRFTTRQLAIAGIIAAPIRGAGLLRIGLASPTAAIQCRFSEALCSPALPSSPPPPRPVRSGAWANLLGSPPRWTGSSGPAATLLAAVGPSTPITNGWPPAARPLQRRDRGRCHQLSRRASPSGRRFAFNAVTVGARPSPASFWAGCC